MDKFKKALFPIFFVIFMDNFGFGVIFNMIPTVFLDTHFHLLPRSTSDATRNFFLAITFGVFPLTQLFGAPLIGDFADHFGRKKALYLTILAVTLGYIVSGMALSINSLTLLILSRLVTGFFAGNLSVCLAAIADLSPDEHSRARNFSHVTTLFGLSWIFAMVISGYVSDPALLGKHGPMVVFLVTALFSFLSFLAVKFFYDESCTSQSQVKFDLLKGIKNIGEALVLKKVRTLFVAYFFWVIGWGMMIQWYPAYAIEAFRATPFSTTTWMTIFGITWTLGSSILNNLLLKRLHSVSIAVIGSILITVCLAANIFIPWFILFNLVLTAGAIFAAFTMCNTMNLTSMAAPPDVQGKVMGLSQSIMSFGWIVTSVIATILVRSDIHLILWSTAICLVLCSLILAAIFAAHKAKHLSEEPLTKSHFVDHQKD